MIIALERADIASDNLLQTLSRLYGVKSAQIKSKQRVGFKVVSISNKPSLASKKISFKAFTVSDEQSEYGEFFINFDFVENTVTLAEKDLEYRGAIIKYLAEGTH